MKTPRITQAAFYDELKKREITEYDFINFIENNYLTILNFRDFRTDFDRKGHLTAPKEALFKMFLEKHDERTRFLTLKKLAKELTIVATGIA